MISRFKMTPGLEIMKEFVVRLIISFSFPFPEILSVTLRYFFTMHTNWAIVSMTDISSQVSFFGRAPLSASLSPSQPLSL